jgi:hypothetical protein
MTFAVYNGPDSKGSNGYIYYRNLQYAKEKGLVKVVKEPYVKTNSTTHSSRRRAAVATDDEETAKRLDNVHVDDTSSKSSSEPLCDGCEVTPLNKEDSFIYIETQKTDKGPRDSVRLEGKRQFNRGLFILDVRHMPAGCGTWPAFWLVDELNWPVSKFQRDRK